MPSRTFFALFNEGYKLDIYERRALLTIAAYPHMDDEGRASVDQGYALPDDFLSDIVDSEKRDDLTELKQALEGTEEENGN